MSSLAPLPTLGQLDQPIARLDPLRVCPGLGAGRVESVGQVLQGVRKQVSVAVHRDLDRAVPKVRLDRLGVGTLRDQQCGAGVPEVMEADLFGQASTVKRRAE
jgi:hypothetical protein